MLSPKVISVIRHLDLRGTGIENDPYRRICQYLDFDGNLLAEERDTVNAASDTKELAAKSTNSAMDAIASLNDALAYLVHQKVDNAAVHIKQAIATLRQQHQ